MDEHIQDLLAKVSSESRVEAWEAAKELASVATKLASSLIGILENAESADARSRAAYVLGWGAFAVGRIPLEERLSSLDEDPGTRGHAAEALAYIQARESVNVLLKHLTDQDSGVKYWCAFALGQLGGVEAIAALEKLAQDAKDEAYDGHSLRAEALDAIAQIADRAR